MRANSVRRLPVVLGAMAVCVWAALPARADTVATFADPSTNGNPSLFQAIGSTLTGGWSGTGLTLITPINNQVYQDVTFTMTPTQMPVFGTLLDGVIEFRSSSNDSLLTVGWDTAQLSMLGWGSSDLIPGSNVQIGGPVVPHPLQDESFSFSFANQQEVQGGGYAWTAAFTCSATPEPGTIVTLALTALCRRRR